MIQNLAKCVVLACMVSLASCHGHPTEEIVTKMQNGQFKVVIRSQEFHHSAVHNVDICVDLASSKLFPENKLQCFLHGFDFSGLSAKWVSDRDIEVSFTCGRVTHFTNSAVVYPNGPVPVEFHATLRDGCGP